MGLGEAVLAVADILREVTGLSKKVSDYPTDDALGNPFIVVYSRSGSFEQTSGSLLTGMHNIVIEMHFGRGHLPDVVKAAMVYCELIPKTLLRHPTLDGTVDNFSRINYTFGPLYYGEKETVGFQWTLAEVKILN
jgi:hypothetical protein